MADPDDKRMGGEHLRADLNVGLRESRRQRARDERARRQHLAALERDGQRHVGDKTSRTRQPVRDARHGHVELRGVFESHGVVEDRPARKQARPGQRVRARLLRPPATAVRLGGSTRHQQQLGALGARARDTREDVGEPGPARDEHHHRLARDEVRLDGRKGRARFMAKVRERRHCAPQRVAKHRDGAADHAIGATNPEGDDRVREGSREAPRRLRRLDLVLRNERTTRRRTALQCGGPNQSFHRIILHDEMALVLLNKAPGSVGVMPHRPPNCFCVSADADVTRRAPSRNTTAPPRCVWKRRCPLNISLHFRVVKRRWPKVVVALLRVRTTPSSAAHRCTARLDPGRCYGVEAARRIGA